MDMISMRDLSEGRNEWCNIPEVLRATLKIIVEESVRCRQDTTTKSDLLLRRIENLETGALAARSDIRDLTVFRID